MPGELTPPEFVQKWKRVELSERAASQEHFIDLCKLLGQPTPASHDATGSEYTFEKTVPVLGVYAAVDAGGEWSEDWADVWTETGVGQPLPEDHELYEKRQETDQKVLANLLRMNLDRADEPQSENRLQVDER